MSDPVRLDKWLWAARFFKTRSLAARAIEGGKVEVNGDRVKRARLVHVGDQVRLRQGPFEYQLVVQGLSETRGPAPVASTLYQETPASIRTREMLAAQMKLELFMKDLHLILDEGRRVGAALPLTSVAERLFDRACAAGHGAEDLAVVAALLDSGAACEIP